MIFLSFFCIDAFFHFRFYVMKNSRKAVKQHATGMFELDYHVVVSKS